MTTPRPPAPDAAPDPSLPDGMLPHGGMLLLDPSAPVKRPSRRRVVVVGAALAASIGTVAFLLARPSEEVRAARLREQAEHAFADRQFGEAETFARKALELEAGRADAHALLGEILLASSREAESDLEFDAALRSDPGHADANAAVARRALAKGDQAAAEPFLDRALRASGARSDLRYLRAEVRLARGDLGGAMEDLRAGLAGPVVREASAKALLAAHLAGFLARVTGDPAWLEDAAAALRRFPTLRAESRLPPDPRLLAEWHLAAGRPRSALAVLAEEPATAPVAGLRGEAHRMGDEAEQAEMVLRDALARTESAPLRVSLVRLLAEQGRVRAAGLEAQEALRRHPEDLPVAEAARATAGAVVAAQRPDDLLLLALRAPPAEYDPLEPLFVQRVLTTPRGPAALAAAVQVRGEVWLSSSWDEATVAALTRDVEALLAARPDDLVGLSWKGALAARRGDTREALRVLDVAVEAALRPGRERLARAAVLFAVGRFADVLEDARTISRTSGPSPVCAVLETRGLLALDQAGPALAAARLASSRWPEDVAVLAALQAVLAAAPPAGDDDGRREAAVVDLRLAAARLDSDATQRALAAVGDPSDSDAASRSLGAQVWDDLAAEWAARERDAPGDVRAPLARSASLVRAGRPRLAEQVLRSAAERFDDPRIRVARARVLSSLGGFDEAEAVLRSLARNDPRPEVGLEIARVLASAGRRDEACTALREILSTPGPMPIQAAAAADLVGDPDATGDDADSVERWLRSLPAGALPGVERDLLAGYVALVRGRLSQVALAPPEAGTPVRVRSALLVARASLAAGEVERAEEVLVQASALAPRDAMVRALLAHVRLVRGTAACSAGDLESAARHFERAVTGSELDVLAAVVLADVSLRRRDLPAAVETARRLALTRRGSPAPPMFRGYLELGRGRGDGVLADLEEALLCAPSEPAVLAAYVEACVRDGRTDDAARACRRVVDAGDRLGFATFLLGRLAWRGGAPEEAESLLRRALARDAGNFAALSLLAEVLRGSGRAEEARGLVVAVRPEDLPEPPRASRFERLRLSVETGTVVGAADRLRELLEGRPNPAGAALALGSALLACGEPERAAAHLEQALAADPGSFEASALLVRAYSDLGRLDEAERRLADRTTASPSDPGAWCLRAMIESHRGRHDDAVASYRRALAVAPRSALAANNLACLLHEAGPTRVEALELIARTARELPQEPRLAATHAWLLLREGRASAALDVVDDAIPLHPGDALLRVHRAEALRRLGREDAAASELRSALRIDAEALRDAGPELRKLAAPRR